MTPSVALMQSQGKEITVERNPEPPVMDVPMKRMGVLDDIATTVLFFASEMSSYVTGSQLIVE
jgi:NAD(P)-dependent dehydrogenase (short-subunit alcohol dehydrogenase family)